MNITRSNIPNIFCAQKLTISMSNSILVIDDEQDIRVLIKYNLEKEGFVVSQAEDGEKGVEVAQKQVPDLILLDVMMPVLDGMETCALLRKEPSLSDCIIAFLTARGEDYSELAGFNSGADDYITKPVKPKVLVSRIKAMLRRIKGPQPLEVIEKHGISVDRDRYMVLQHGKEMTLPKKEFELLSLLWSVPGKVFTREAILTKVWGTQVVVGDRTIDVHIRKLRAKLGDELFVTVKGIGYKFGQ
jgi:two-component system alkaline phosphatase synthesis response regulator PhoP